MGRSYCLTPIPSARITAVFEGRLPDFNLGTADGASADPASPGKCWTL